MALENELGAFLGDMVDADELLAPYLDGDELPTVGQHPIEFEQASGVVPEHELRINIEEHTYHKVIQERTGEKLKQVLVVSKDRSFTLKLVLLDGNNRLAVENTLQLDVTVVFENGDPVPMAAHEQPLVGPTRATFIQGRAEFKINMGRSVLSQKHAEQKFRIKAFPTDESLQITNGNLTLHTEPMKSVTKLNRKKAAGAAGPPAKASGALVQKSSDLQALVDEERKERQLLEHKMLLLLMESEQKQREAMESERKQREAVEAAMKQQQQTIDMLVNMLEGLNPVGGAAPTPPFAKTAMLPPPAPVADCQPILPQSLRSRSPKPGASDQAPPARPVDDRSPVR